MNCCNHNLKLVSFFVSHSYREGIFDSRNLASVTSIFKILYTNYNIWTCLIIFKFLWVVLIDVSDLTHENLDGVEYTNGNKITYVNSYLNTTLNPRNLISFVLWQIARLMLNTCFSFLHYMYFWLAGRHHLDDWISFLLVFKFFYIAIALCKLEGVKVP